MPNQPTQPTNQPTSKTTGQPTSQPTNQPTDQPINRPINQPRSTNQPTNQPNNRPTNHRPTKASLTTTARPSLSPPLIHFQSLHATCCSATGNSDPQSTHKATPHVPIRLCSTKPHHMYQFDFAVNLTLSSLLRSTLGTIPGFTLSSGRVRPLSHAQPLAPSSLSSSASTSSLSSSASTSPAHY